jgi:multiple sugar transport system substrate-binding protein
MRRVSAWLSFSLCVAGLLTAIADAAQTERLIFLSTQLRPIEEAQKMRNLILKGFPGEVDYITEQPQHFPLRVEAEQEGGTHTIDVVGALHGELQPLVPLDALVPLDDLAGKLTRLGIPDSLLALGKSPAGRMRVSCKAVSSASSSSVRSSTTERPLLQFKPPA